MELRLLRYFLTAAKEQSFTKAAEQLHITQPTLSRQMAAFEEELGITLFIRSGKKISLTDEGILLKRRALEIFNLEEKTLEELKGKEEVVEGTITIGCGEFAAVETLCYFWNRWTQKGWIISGLRIALQVNWMDKKSRSSVEMNDKKYRPEIVEKKIVLFATSGGSGFGNTVKELQPSATDAVIIEGRLLNYGTVIRL